MDKITLINLMLFTVILSGMTGVWMNSHTKPTKSTENNQNQILNDMVLKNYVDNLEDVKRRNYILRRDENAYANDMAPPERRVPEYQYPFDYIKSQINIPTRGYPEPYHQIGIATHDEKAFNLFGRQTYPSSNQYEYYVVGTMGYTNVKIPVGTKGKKEIMDGDHIRIHGNDGEYKVKLFDYDVPRYVPVV
jgi:hypothetical protein